MKYLFIILAGFAIASCGTSDKQGTSLVAHKEHDASKEPQTSGSQTIDSSNLTTIVWLDPVTLDLGSITKGQVVEVSWKFKNTGTKPLTIESVQAGCGCTTPEPPKEPIAPGTEGVIKAKFNSENFSGHVTKEVTVTANNRNPNNGSNNRLTFSADIKE
ncbi:MAG TPA: DUF1573 domain-containing protein [Flavisolibacter sp.]|jgi:hypothetical protein